MKICYSRHCLSTERITQVIFGLNWLQVNCEGFEKNGERAGGSAASAQLFVPSLRSHWQLRYQQALIHHHYSLAPHWLAGHMGLRTMN